ncbi:hypothetical protein [Aquihabitans sp. McL0605]|uniref:hypothetical protein n=1 Tax=Aquihabitans sp. McL0605 TaxID=3415671 RepID=UPI003CECCA8E
MRRALGSILIAGLLMGAAACGTSGGSDSKPSGGSTVTTADSGSDSGGSGEVASGNKAVAAYCKAVDEYVKKAKAAMNDPAKASTLATEGQDLSKKAVALSTSGLSADDAKAVGDCTKKSTDALIPG